MVLSKNDFEIMLRGGKPLTEATIKNRVYYIDKLYRDIGSDAKDLSFLGNSKAVIKYVNESDKTDVHKTRWFHILSILDTPAGKIVSAATKKRYRETANRLRDEQRHARKGSGELHFSVWCKHSPGAISHQVVQQLRTATVIQDQWRGFRSVEHS